MEESQVEDQEDPNKSDDENYQFLKCQIDKDNKPPPVYLDPLIIPEHVALKRTTPNNSDDNRSEIIETACSPSSQVNLNRDSSRTGSRIFARQCDQDGSWLLKWDVEKRNEGDFLALCYEGESINLYCYSIIKNFYIYGILRCMNYMRGISSNRMFLCMTLTLKGANDQVNSSLFVSESLFQ